LPLAADAARPAGRYDFGTGRRVRRGRRHVQRGRLHGGGAVRHPDVDPGPTSPGDRGGRMNTITLTLPPSLHERAKALAERDHISLDQFVALAVAEKLSAL